MALGNVGGLTQHDSCPRKKREREEDGVGVGGEIYFKKFG